MANEFPGATFRARPSGLDLNGGGFNASYGGVDYTNQDSAQVTLTNLACVGGGSTTVTSASAAFTAQMVGNVLRISAGTNFTLSRYMIVAFNSSTSVTLDRTPAAGAAASSGTCRVGGAVLTFGELLTGVNMGSYGLMASGTYTQTSQISATPATSVYMKTIFAESVGLAVITINMPFTSTALISGLGDFHFDGLVFTTTGNACAGMGYTGTAIFTRCQWLNFVTNGNFAIISVQSSFPDLYPFSIFQDCVFDGCTWPTPGTGTGVACIRFPFEGGSMYLSRCVFANMTQRAISAYVGSFNISGMKIDNCIFYNLTGSTTDAIYATGVNPVRIQVRHSIFHTIGRTGILFGGVGSGLGGFRCQVDKCIFWGCGEYGVGQDPSSLTFQYPYWLKCNAGGNNTLGNYQSAVIVNAVTNFTTLTVDPFVSAVGQDFALNDTPGGGQTVIDDTTSCYSFADIGITIGEEPPAGIAVECPSGGGPIVYGWVNI